MGFWSLLEAASNPVVEVLLVSLLGAFMTTGYCNLLSTDTLKSLNKIVFMVFTPCLMFASLAKTVTLEDIISWWFMPINVGMTFLLGGILGWIVVKILRPAPHLEGLIIAACSSGNMGNLPIIILPAVCDEDGSPFGERDACRSVGLSYASFSMALGGFYIWTYTYQTMRASALKFQALQDAEDVAKEPNKDLDASQQTQLLNEVDPENAAVTVYAPESVEDIEKKPITSQKPKKVSFWTKVIQVMHQIIKELMAPPTLAAIIGFVFGATKWLKNLIIGDSAPLRVLQDSVKLLGDATIPCVTLILGGNLIQGLRSSKVKPAIIIGVILVRYVVLPAIGIWVVKLAANLGLLPPHPLFHYALMLQYTLPPAMNIGTMTQFFNVGQEECSIIFLWTYSVAVLALTVWATVFMWILA